MLTQIYEVRTPDVARAVCAMGVDHVGVLIGWGDFPREIDPAAARAVAAAIRPPARFCALFLGADIARIETAARALAPDILHLGAAPELLDVAAVSALKRALRGIAIMRSIPVVDETSVAIARAHDMADFLLLDTHREDDRQIGALGITHDWSISRRIVEAVTVPVILAGGLGPANVVDAVRAVGPAGVESKPRTDVSGTHDKDLALVRAFHEAARAA
jgi:phosphoribosylanthranilate isomerase